MKKIYNRFEDLHRDLIKEIGKKGKNIKVRASRTRELIDFSFKYNFDDYVRINSILTHGEYCEDKISENIDKWWYVKKQLDSDLNSRRAVLDFFDIDLGNPYCYISAHFIIRNKKLIVIVYWRSLDVKNKLEQDLEFFSYLADEICDTFDVELDYIKANVGSLHYYTLHYYTK